MTTIITRTSKGTAILPTEMDANFNNLNTYKAEDTDVRSIVKPTLTLDFANSKTLDPRITFTRNAAATYYDGKTSAVAEQNLLPYSQNPGGTGWINNYTTTVANTAVAPNGTTTANLVYPNSNTFGMRIYNTGFTTTSSTPYTFSVYAKAAGLTWLYLGQPNNGGYGVAWFNLSTGTVGTTLSGYYSASIASVGNGWYRCAVTWYNAITVNATCAWSFSDADGGNTVTPSGTNGVYLWAAQVEQRSSMTDYTPTTTAAITNYIPVLQTAPINTPRFDFDPVTGESKGLLIEEQQTNLILYSGDLTNAAYTKTNLTTINSNIAPDGTLSATKLINNSGAYGFLYQTVSSLSLTAAYTYSVHLKADELTTARVQVVSGPNSAYVDVNLSNGTLSAPVSSGLNTGTIITSGYTYITPVGNGWYRVSLAFASTASSASCFVYSTAAGNGFNGFFAWGMQLQATCNDNRYLYIARSYIPTTSSAATVGWENAIMSGSNFSSWYNTSQGTFLATFKGGGMQSQGTYGRILMAGNFNWAGNGGGFSFSVYTNLQNPGIYPLTSDFTVNFTNAAFGYSQNNITQGVGGYISNTTAGVAMFPLSTNTTLAIGSAISYYPLNGNIKKITYYPKQFTAAQLQSLTT